MTALLFWTGMLTAAVTDLRRQIIPTVTYVLLAAAALLGILLQRQDWRESLIALLLMGIPMLFVAMWTGGLGGGDVKLFALAAAAAGILPALCATGMALTMAVMSCGFLRGKTVPLAPFLAAGYLMTYMLL